MIALQAIKQCAIAVANLNDLFQLDSQLRFNFHFSSKNRVILLLLANFFLHVWLTCCLTVSKINDWQSYSKKVSSCITVRLLIIARLNSLKLLIYFAF